MNKLSEIEIKKKDLLKIKEEDVMFITNPGRMGDEDGITFFVKQENKYSKYRINGLMYPNRSIKKEEQITLKDVSKQFPKWKDAWHNATNKEYTGKYKYLYMGFGNGLCIDNLVYDDYKLYLDKEIKSYLKENKKDLEYIIYDVWEKALMKMISK